MIRLLLRDKVAIDSIADDDIAIGRDHLVLFDDSSAGTHGRAKHVVSVFATFL